MISYQLKIRLIVVLNNYMNEIETQLKSILDNDLKEYYKTELLEITELLTMINL